MIKLQRRKEFTRMKAPKGPDHFQSHTLTRRRVCWISGWMTGNCQTFKNITHLLPQLIVNMSYQVTFPYIQSVRLGILKKLQSQLKMFFSVMTGFSKIGRVFSILSHHRFAIVSVLRSPSSSGEDPAVGRWLDLLAVWQPMSFLVGENSMKVTSDA